MREAVSISETQVHGAPCNYAHENNFAEQEFLPDSLSGSKFCEPGDNTREKEVRQWLRRRWEGKYGC